MRHNSWTLYAFCKRDGRKKNDQNERLDLQKKTESLIVSLHI